MYDALRLRLRSARTTLEPAPGPGAPSAAVQPAAPAANARSDEGRDSGRGTAADGGAAAPGESSSGAMEGAFGSTGGGLTADEPKPMDE